LPRTTRATHFTTRDTLHSPHYLYTTAYGLRPAVFVITTRWVVNVAAHTLPVFAITRCCLPYAYVDRCAPRTALNRCLPPSHPRTDLTLPPLPGPRVTVPVARCYFATFGSVAGWFYVHIALLYPHARTTLPPPRSPLPYAGLHFTAHAAPRPTFRFHYQLILVGLGWISITPFAPHPLPLCRATTTFTINSGAALLVGYLCNLYPFNIYTFPFTTPRITV